MKKLLSLLTVVVLSLALVANAAESKLQSFVNKKLEPLTQKEQEINSKIEAQKKADAERKAEWEKKQAEQAKALEAKKAELAKQQAEAEARREATKKAVETEVNYLKGLFGK